MRGNDNNRYQQREVVKVLEDGRSGRVCAPSCFLDVYRGLLE